MKEADVILSIIVLRDFDALDIPQNITLVHYIDYIMLIESEVTGSWEVLIRNMQMRGLGFDLTKIQEQITLVKYLGFSGLE